MSCSRLLEYLEPARRLFVITGAGCSAPSGIDTYRDDAGEWRRDPPIQQQDFLNSRVTRKRYWARSMRGWPMFRDATPNAAHQALADLEQAGRLQVVVTQNVDGLHQRAGQSRLIELHGGLSRVRCLDCAEAVDRNDLQSWLEIHNRDWLAEGIQARPDGDAQFDNSVGQFEAFNDPLCQCGGALKPDVVFYGDSVPAERVAAVRHELAAADTLLVVGSSLMVYSSFRFVREARALGLPLLAINRGRTRADDWFDYKWAIDGAVALPDLVRAL